MVSNRLIYRELISIIALGIVLPGFRRADFAESLVACTGCSSRVICKLWFGRLEVWNASVVYLACADL